MSRLKQRHIQHNLLGKLNWRSGALQLDLMSLPQRNARLLKAQFDAATQLPGNIIFAIESRAHLQTKNRAVQRERFYAENARTVLQDG